MGERTLDPDRSAAVAGYSAVRVVPSAGSTNADLAALARAGTDVPQALLTTNQTAGRGRLDRRWEAPPDSGLACSVLLVPPRPPAEWSWLPLLTGVAVCAALDETCGVAPTLKWPNDVLLGEKKVCGILAERVQTPSGPAAVLGIGVNVDFGPDQLPVPTATALSLAGATTLDRTTIAVALLEAVLATVTDWDTDAYAARCATLGRPVRVLLPDGEVTGTAERIDEAGRLVVDGQAFSAGDVVHLR